MAGRTSKIAIGIGMRGQGQTTSKPHGSGLGPLAASTLWKSNAAGQHLSLCSANESITTRIIDRKTARSEAISPFPALVDGLK